MQDIVVFIELDTKPVPRETLLPLILSTEGAQDYAEFSSLDAVKAVYPENSKTYACAKALFSQVEKSVAPIKKCAIFGVAADMTDANVVKAVKDLRSAYDDWYFLIPVESNPARISALAAWAKSTVLTKAQIIAGEIEAEKLLVVQTDSKTIKCTLPQTVVCYNYQADGSYMHAAWVGRVAPNYPKAVSWKWKELCEIAITDLEGPALHELLESNVNTYIRNNKREYMSEGICADGEFVDTVIGRWQIKQSIRQRLTNLHVDNEVIPYDNTGFTLVGAEIIAALNEAVGNGIILSENGVGVFAVDIPKRQDATRDQASRRVMPPIAWRATLRGGVHGVEVNGLITVSLMKAAA